MVPGSVFLWRLLYGGPNVRVLNERRNVPCFEMFYSLGEYSRILLACLDPCRLYMSIKSENKRELSRRFRPMRRPVASHTALCRGLKVWRYTTGRVPTVSDSWSSHLFLGRPANVSREVRGRGVTDKGVYLALEGLVSQDVISKSSNVAKCNGALPGCVIWQWKETGTR